MQNIPSNLRINTQNNYGNIIHSFVIKKNLISIQLNGLTDSLSFELINPNKDSIQLNGFTLSNSKAKINYYTIGLNGAKASTFYIIICFSSPYTT